MPKPASGWAYAFAIGKIRARERFFIRAEVFQEAMASGLEEALRLLSESGRYGQSLRQVKDSPGLEAVLTEELAGLQAMLEDLLLDRELVGLLKLSDLACAQRIVQNYPSSFLSDYIHHLIDLHNIKTFLRLYMLKVPAQKLERRLTCCGFVRREFFLALYPRDLGLFLARLAEVRKREAQINYAAYLAEAVKRLEKEVSFVALEKAASDFLMAALRPARYLSCGPEPLLAYYFAKVNEINLMRMIILAKLNGVGSDLAQERRNDVYA